MSENDKALAKVDMSMLDAAVEADTGGRKKSVIDMLHTLKIYNPRIGTDIDETKAGKFIMKLANSGDEKIIDGPIEFNPLAVKYFYNGSVYPILPDGSFAKDKIFFFTNEFGKFEKKTDTIAFGHQNGTVGFYLKGEFEQMVKCKNLNGQENPFYERKKDADGRPYDASQISKGCVIYGKFTSGEYENQYFRFFTNPKNLGITFKKEGNDFVNVDPEPTTFEYEVNRGIEPLNSILEENGKKAVRNIEPSQVVLSIGIYQNDKKNFMPAFEYEDIMVLRGENNIEEVKYIHDLGNAYFEERFGRMGPASKITIVGSSAECSFVAPEIKESGEMSDEELKKLPDGASKEDVQEVFGEIVDTPIEDKDLSTPDF